MSDTHQVDNGDGTFAVALHYPVPDILNDVGMNYRDALVASEIGLLPDGRRTILTSINPAEEFLLDTGELYEHRLSQSSLLTQLQLGALYVSEQPVVFQLLQDALQDFEEPDMATYTEQFDLRQNSTLLNRITAALADAANSILNEETPVLERVDWAKTAIILPKPQAAEFIWALLVQNSSADVDAILAAPDTAFLAAVNTAIDQRFGSAA